MNKEELAIIKQAILNEIEGYEFYKMASEKETSKEGKEAFIELANEELKHVEYLQELFSKIKDGDEEDFQLAFLSNPPSPRIFDWKKIEVGNNSLAVSVFGIGIQIEKASIDFYQEAMVKTQNIMAKKLFEILVSWEKVHLNQFTDAYNFHKEEWWAAQGYAPF
jgi:rubrerythrin